MHHYFNWVNLLLKVLGGNKYESSLKLEIPFQYTLRGINENMAFICYCIFTIKKQLVLCKVNHFPDKDIKVM